MYEEENKKALGLNVVEEIGKQSVRWSDDRCVSQISGENSAI